MLLFQANKSLLEIPLKTKTKIIERNSKIRSEDEGYSFQTLQQSESTQLPQTFTILSMMKNAKKALK